MERNTDISLAKQIMGKNFIGLDELKSINHKMKLLLPESIEPTVPFDEQTLSQNADSAILILGTAFSMDNQPYTLNYMRDLFGMNPDIAEPCFYHQDWYLNESFAKEKILKQDWYFLNKTIPQSTRGKLPDKEVSKLPIAILTAYVFFANYFLNHEVLWVHDYIWCSDEDTNGDIIYTGRYEDFNHVNKNGFSIHRHLKIREFYGTVSTI